MSELALDHVERDAFASHLDRMGVAQLMRREPLANAGLVREPPQLCSHGAGRPGPATGGAFDDAEKPADRKLRAVAEPWAQLLPAPVVHADFTSFSALAVADQKCAASLVQVSLAEL